MSSLSAQKKKKRAGMSLVEIALALLIVAILAVVVPTALRFPHYLAVSSVQKEVAIHAANQVLEEALSFGYDHAYLSAGTVSLDGMKGDYSMSGLELAVIKKIEILAAGTPAERKQITVTVTYRNNEDPVVLQTVMTP